MSEIVNAISAVFETLPKQFASPNVLAALKKASDLNIEVPASEKPLFKFLETFAYATEEFLEHDPGLFYTMLGLDTQQSRERQKQLDDLLRVFLLWDRAAPAEHTRTHVPELPTYQIGEALNNLSFRLHRYRGALDGPAFAQWAFARSIVEARLLVFHAQLLTEYRGCIYAGFCRS